MTTESDINTKLDLLLDLNKTLLAHIEDQNKAIKALQKDNEQIISNSTKMALHIEFINQTYTRIRQSTFFRTILG